MRNRSLAVLTACALAGAAAAQPTAFTYQGRLSNGGQPAQGVHDFRFRLFEAPTGGSQLGQAQCVDNVGVAEGLFAVQMDFGQQFATPQPRFLAIEVREDTGLGCGNSSGFVELSPRQPLTAAPLANHARSAFSLDAADGSPLSAVLVDNSGNVGIGTLTPGTRLEVNSGFIGDGVLLRGIAPSDPGFHLYDGANPRGSLGLALQPGIWSTDAVPGDIVLRTQFVDNRLLLQNSSGASALAVSSNRVGIGTPIPLAKLDVRGDIRFGVNAQVRAVGAEENLRIVRGVVGKTGGIFAGSGFQVSHPLDGHYTITFDPPFSGLPTVTVTGEFETHNALAQTDGVTTDFANILIRLAHVSNEPFDAPFHFTAIGPR